MHRISAGLLIALFGFALVSPAVLASGDDSNLPPCCRRAGKHHCAMQDLHPSAGPTLRGARCPLYPIAPNAPANRIVTVAGSRLPAFAGLLGHPADHRDRTSISRITFLRPGEKRGPPALLG
jgi:hypothetical protein